MTTRISNDKIDKTAELNGRKVQAFQLRMDNLGFQRMADEIVDMLDHPEVWQHWKDGLGYVQLLSGEFDYFLSLAGVTRDSVMAIRDVELKARMETAMDERKTGDDGYRRPYVKVKAALGSRRKAEPFGLTKTEAKALLGDKASDGRLDRPALGRSVRRYANSNGRTTRQPSDQRPRWERLAASVIRLPDNELELLFDRVKSERQKRKKKTDT